MAIVGMMVRSRSKSRAWRCVVRRTRTSSGMGDDYLKSLVKQHDYEHYLALLLLPSSARQAAFAIRAFNVELAMIRSLVSDKNIGRMRMKFWRDAVDSIYNTSPPNQPVAVALREAVRTKNLSKQWLTRMLDARESNLDDQPYVTLKDVEDYAENTSSSTLYLTLEAVGVRDVHADHAASHLGKAEGLVTLLRATPYHTHNKKVFLPMELLALHRLSQEDILRGKNTSRLQDVVYDVASQAKMHLKTARSLSNKITFDAKTCLLPAIPCSNFLDDIQKYDFNIFDGRLQQRAALLPFALLWHRLWRRY